MISISRLKKNTVSRFLLKIKNGLFKKINCEILFNLPEFTEIYIILDSLVYKKTVRCSLNKISIFYFMIFKNRNKIKKKIDLKKTGE